MSKWFPALLACFVLGPSVTIGQSANLTYQPTSVRQICKGSPVLDSAGGGEIDRVAAGDSISVTDLSFDADGAMHFQYGNGDRPRFIASGTAKHFCGYADRSGSRPIAFLAPPNTCHVIAASRRTLDEVNLFAADYHDYAPVMNVFRAKNGWYAISLGLVSNQIAKHLLSTGQNIPGDAYCSDGGNYFDVLVQRDGRFFELSPPPLTDPQDRQNEASDLLRKDAEGEEADRFQRSCYLGNGDGCGLSASLLARVDDPSEVEIEQITRFNLLGCILGAPVACNNALSGKSVRNRAVFAAFPDRISAASAPPVLDLELAKVGCDAGLATSCYEIAKPAMQYASRDVTEYLTSVEATFHACKRKQSWYCREFAERLDYRRTVMDNEWPPLAQFGTAKLIAGTCQDAGQADFSECRQAYGQYRRFIESGEGSDDQRNVAAMAIRDGCDAESPTACAYQSALSDYFSVEERRAAAAKVNAACEAGESRGNICDQLDTTLGGDLPEAQDPIRAEYERRVVACRTTEGTDSSNPCRDALWYYGGHISLDDLSEPLALLRENCGIDGKITGCEPLYRYYNGDELLFADESVRARFPRQPKKAMEALQAGCVATLEGVSNCGSLGLTLERQGDYEAAARAYATGCDTGMTATRDQYFGQGRVCYWAGENAYKNLQDYASARRWLGFDCQVHDNPISCKYLGLMNAQAEGGPADPVAALTYYQMGCNMHGELGQRDGQSCLLFGQALVAQRDIVAADASFDYHMITAEDGPSDDFVAENLTEASRAYLRACTEDLAEACTSHARLLQQWSSGAYPREDYQCRVIDVRGQMAPAKSCQQFSFYLAAPDGNGEEGWANVFVWPDGDRTVTFDDYGEPTLNGVIGVWVLPEGGWECIQSSATGRSFCYAPA